jgi:hypothetical protein
MSNNPNRAAYYNLELEVAEWKDEWEKTPASFWEVMALDLQIQALIRQKINIMTEAGPLPGPLAYGKVNILDNQICFRVLAQQRWYR